MSTYTNSNGFGEIPVDRSILFLSLSVV